LLLTELLSEDRIKVPLRSQTKDDLLQELVALVTQGRDEATFEAVLSAVRERERELSTGIGGGIAIPHGKTPVCDQLVMAAGTCPAGVDFEALDDQPVRLFFLLVGPESAAGAHIKTLARISRLLRRDALRDALCQARTPGAFLDVVRASEAA
jgi:mannitol/fructose-specific phosphotransferase system IIA component (Ntr-type)